MFQELRMRFSAAKLWSDFTCRKVTWFRTLLTIEIYFLVYAE